MGGEYGLEQGKQEISQVQIQAAQAESKNPARCRKKEGRKEDTGKETSR